LLKQKGLKTIIISLLIILSTTCFSFLFTNAYSSFNKENTKASGVYTFKTDSDDFFSTNLKDLNYINNTTFEISSPRALFNFSICSARGYTFDTKKVILTDNIDWAKLGWNYYPIGSSMQGSTYNDESPTEFKGEFDGQNFTISNLTTTVDDSPWNDWFYVGLFAILGETAEVKNLKIENFTINLNEDDGYATIGAIAGMAYLDDNLPSIENCIVKKFTINNEVTGSLISGIVGSVADEYGKTMSVKNISVTEYSVTNISSSYVYGLAPAYNVGSGGYCTIENYVYDNSDIDIGDGCTFINGWDGNKFDKNDKICSNKGGNSTQSGAAWYCIGEEYNDGWPMLRSFIKDWTTMNFDTNATAGSFESSFIVPTSIAQSVVEQKICFGDFKNSPSIPGYGTTITAGSKAGYVFSNWEWAGVNWCYNAVYTPESYTLQFNNSTGVSSITPKVDSTVIKYGDTISCKMDGTTAIYLQNDSIYLAEYELGTGIKIKSWGNLNGTMLGTSKITVPDLEDGQTYEITPEVEYIMFKLTFDATSVGEYVERKSGNAEYNVRAGTKVDISKTERECTYTIKQPGLSNVTVKYELKAKNVDLNGTTRDVSELFIIEPKIYSEQTVSRDWNLTPSVTQTTKYVQFVNAKILTEASSYEPSYKELIKVDIASASRIIGTETIGESTNTITYTFTDSLGVSKTITYSIDSEYKVKEYVNASADYINTIYPVIEQKYVKLKFQVIETNNTTDGKVIGANGGTTELIALMDVSSTFIDTYNQESKEITFTYTKDGKEEKVTYNLTKIKNTKYYDYTNPSATERYVMNPASGTPRQVNVVIKLKTYGILFG